MTSATKFNSAICASAEHVTKHCDGSDDQMRALTFIAFFRGYLTPTASAAALQALDDVLGKPRELPAPIEDKASGAAC